MTKRELSNLVNECFDKDFTPKACGREKCIELINAMNSYFSGTEHKSFGNSETGFMNVWAMKMQLFATNNC